jgi:hypothetical protein
VDCFCVGRWTDPATGHAHRLSAFLMTLAHSRHLLLYPVLREDELTWLEAHVAACTCFDGVPQRLVPDHLTAAIVKADRDDPRLNRAYSELTRYDGCLVDPARVGHPKDKPRVERRVAYARERFFRGRTFDSLEQRRTEAVIWAREVAGQRVHGTTGERPLVALLQRGRAALLPLPAAPWELVRWTQATVHADCHLSAAGARYSVPYGYVGRLLDVRLGQRTVAIYAGAEWVTSHLRHVRGQVTRLEHYPVDAPALVRATPAVCRARAEQVGPATLALVEPLLATRTLHHVREVQAVLRLLEHDLPERLEAACQRALEAGDGRLRTVRGLLERGWDHRALAPEPGALAATARAFLRGPAAFAGPAARESAPAREPAAAPSGERAGPCAPDGPAPAARLPPHDGAGARAPGRRELP